MAGARKKGPRDKARPKSKVLAANDAAKADQPKSPFTPDEYNSVVAQAELDHIVLLRCDYEIKQFIGDAAKDVDKSVDSDYKNVAYIEKDGVIAGEVEWIAQATKGDEKVFEAKSRYLVVYSGVKSANDAACKAFFFRVARFASYAYFRGLVSHLAWSSELRLPPLPIIKEIKKKVPKPAKS